MKIRVLLLGLVLALAVGVQAQKKDITKFMGIPIDGTKTAMIQKLKAKGFKYNAKLDRLEGEFNGRDSYISVVTNRNKVYRIVVLDANYSNEASIKIRFNSLVRQFMENGKYAPADMLGNFTIDDDVKISYEMTVNNKRFEASFYQMSEADKDTTGIAAFAQQKTYSRYTQEEIQSMTEEEMLVLQYSLAIDWLEKKCGKKSVWFMITELYGQYGIVLYYDNKYNESSGEDL
jgi:hypothetical protein